MTDKRQYVVSDEESAAKVARFITKSLPAKLRVVIEPYRTRRSLAQNALAHLWTACLARHLLETTGQQWAHDDLWEAVKRRTLAPRIIADLETGEPREVYETKTLKVTEFSDWLYAVEAYCLQRWHLQLPHPEDLYDESLGN